MGNDAWSPIDDESLTQRVISTALAADRQPLATAALGSGPGGYLLFLGPAERDSSSEPDSALILGHYALGERPVYGGAAASLRGRAARYRAPMSLAGASGFPFERLWVAAIPTRTLAGALLAEQICLSIWRPPFNSPKFSGLGSRQQGRRRSGQTPSSWDRVFRRPWARAASPAEEGAARLALAALVSAPSVAAPTWPRLPAPPATPTRGMDSRCGAPPQP